MSKVAAGSGVLGIILALFTSIALYELHTRAEAARRFLSSGTSVTADRVMLEVQVGRGTPGLKEVRVEFKTRDHDTVSTSLQWIDLDTPIPREEEQQAPQQGSRYATPLKILYFSENADDAIAETDARRLVENLDRYRPLALTGLGIAAISLACAGGLLLRQWLTSRSRGPSSP
ncbi:hypothetical protein E1218_08355 [Kribbella turkmenica]|uniref:Uncharacterized protein n=1 Tax=Kribbella turkmenica TaxID=2530375 RepID=A0A4R4XBL2_9ACTN|nr:hypothetical protein [Kribbella turkmenica]TDD28046.1 hypothetical protein E1218_08355 [Kribbella turkmenica]